MNGPGSASYLDPRATLEWEGAELGRLPHVAPVLFGTSIAERMFHLPRMPQTWSDYSEVWRPTVVALWRWLAGDTTAYYDISRAMAEFLVNPFNHCEGQDGPPDADTPAVTATLLTAALKLFGGTDLAVSVAQVAVHAAGEIAEARAARLGGRDQYGWALSVDEVDRSDELQGELRAQVDTLRAMRAHALEHTPPVPPALLRELKAI